MLDIQHLDAGYGNFQVLRDVSIHVGAGEIVALMGPNGSGKSTLMNSVSRLTDCFSGTITLNGMEIQTLPTYRLLRLGLAHVLERHRLFPHMSVLENLQLGAGPGAEKALIQKGLDRAYSLFPRLAERKHQAAGSLSGGEQQMCAIARGMMSQPRLLLVDEPFIGLSPHMRAEVAAAISRINAEGVAILLIEQNVAVSLSISSRAYILREGRVVLQGESSDLAKGDRVQKAFLGALA